MNDTRILFSDNGTIRDLTTNLSKYKSGTETIDYVTAEDAIYVGSRYPFNGFYLKMGSTVNAVSAEMSIEYWSGRSRSFQSAVEVIDETNAFSNSGHITFVTDKDEGWVREDTSSDQGGQEIEELNTVRIYDRYWAKITFNQTLTVGVELSFVGQKFSNDDDLGAEYPDLNRSTMLSEPDK